MRGIVKAVGLVAAAGIAATLLWPMGPREAPSEPTALRVWQVPEGAALTYRFEHQHSSALALPLGATADKGGIEADIRLAVEVEVVRVDPSTLGLRFVAVPEHHMHIARQDLLPEAAVPALLGPRAEIPVDASRSFASLVFEPGTPMMFRRLVQLVVTEAQVSLPEAPRASWSADEVTTNGTAISEYEVVSAPAGAATLSRERNAYRGLQALAGRSDVTREVSGSAQVQTDARGVIQRLTATDEIAAQGPRGESVLRLEAHTELTLVSERAASAQIARIADGTRQALDAMVVSEDLERRGLERRANGMTRERLLEEMATLAPVGKLPSHAEWFSSVVARIQAEPEIAGELAPIYHGRNTRKGREVLLDALVWAGHDEAQAVLVELIDSETTRHDDYAPGFVQRLSFVQHPNPATLAYAERQAFAGAGRFETAALYAAGSAAAHARAHMSGAAAARGEAIIGRIAAALEAEADPERQGHLISSLGNADAHEHEPLILAHADSKAPLVRSHVASSLRTNRSPLARATLLRLSADPIGQVQRRALAVLQKNDALTDADLARLGEAVRDARIQELSLPLVVNVVAPYTRKTAAAAAVLQRVIERPLTGEPSIRWRASNLLNHPRTLR